jgi:hypothetical protein
MSEIKEPRFFAYEGERPETFGGPGAAILIDSVVKTQTEYERLFDAANGKRIVGESSPAYLYSPVAAARINDALPNAKIVAVLRDPCERAYSHWVDNVTNGWEPVRDFGRALDLAEQRDQENWWRKWDYIGHGFYAEQLKRYLDRFPADQVKVLMFEDLLGEESDSLGELFEFLGLDPSLLEQRQLPKANAGGLPRSRALARLMSGQSFIRSSMRRVVPAALRARARRELVRRNTSKPPLDAATRVRLQDIYRDDIGQLEAILDRDLSPWLSARN